jgi:tRNA(Ile)-lysidine synthase
VRLVGSAQVSVLHVNYGLRDSADGDERHCAEMCERLRVALEVVRPTRPQTGNLQAWAREERYRAAGALAERHDADVAVGHTATDQVETILYRLASSPSRRALLGMNAREGRLVRPLLAFTREQTATYCTERGLSWREDETNTSDAYARGRVRARLVPALEAIHPAAAQNVLAVAEILREEAEVLDAVVDEVLDGSRGIELTHLRRLAPAIQRLVLQRLADGAVGRPAPGTARRAAEVVAMGEDAQLDLPHGVRAVAERGVLRFVSRADGAS